MTKTSRQYDHAIEGCREVFAVKMKDYGTAWRILRSPSLTDQIYIKAMRIRSIDMKGEHRVQEGIRPEFQGIINYCVMALIQIELGVSEEVYIEPGHAMELYNKHVSAAKKLMEDKNHDYGEAWRNMRISSFTDIILMRLLRIKQIEDNEGKTFVSEGVDSNYYDMINYAVFALIKMEETKFNNL